MCTKFENVNTPKIITTKATITENETAPEVQSYTASPVTPSPLYMTSDPTPTIPTTTSPPKPVAYFNVETDSLHGTSGKKITFKISKQNDGSMDIDSGYFTAPATQIYQFYVRAVSSIQLQRNGITIDYDGRTPKPSKDTDMIASWKRILLNEGDTVNLFNTGPFITYSGELISDDAQWRYTQFIGKAI